MGERGFVTAEERCLYYKQMPLSSQIEPSSAEQSDINATVRHSFVSFGSPTGVVRAAVYPVGHAIAVPVTVHAIGYSIPVTVAAVPRRVVAAIIDGGYNAGGHQCRRGYNNQ